MLEFKRKGGNGHLASLDLAEADLAHVEGVIVTCRVFTTRQQAGKLGGRANGGGSPPTPTSGCTKSGSSHVRGKQP